MESLATVLLHEGHEATAAGSGGLGVTDIAVLVLAAAGLILGLYLLATAVERAPEADDESGDAAGSG